MKRRTNRLAGAAALVTTAMLTWAPAALASSSPPAKGARLSDIVWGGGVATVLTILVLWLGTAHRRSGVRWLSGLAAFASRQSGLPGWAALPAAVTGGSLVIAVFGFYWDVAKHIDTGRDPNPFGTAAHYPILIGLAGIALGGFLAIVLGSKRPLPSSLRIRADWHVPLGGVLIFLCGAFALAGFPLDDVWHSLFGQDVTLWGPTHVLMVGGASLSTLGIWVLLVEGRRAAEQSGHSARRSATVRFWSRAQTLAIAGAFLLGLSALQGEFDYGVPQFQLVFQPILLMLAAGCGLVAARIRLGRLGALQAVAFFLVVRSLLTLAIGPVLGNSTLHFPLYVVEALLVELVAARVSSDRPITLGAAAGALIGTIGLAAEWGWSHVWMPLPWPSSMLAQAAILGFIAAVSGGVLGGFVGRALISTPGARQRGPRWALPVAALGALFCIGFPLPMTSGPATTAALSLRTLQPGAKRTVAVRVALSPANAAKHAQWLTVTSWQGGGLVVDRLRPVGSGVYESTEPIPVYGQWKSILRLENGRALQAAPLYLPEDSAIPAKGVPAQSQATRPLVRDKKILQREAIGGSTWLAIPAYLLLAAIMAGWLLALAAGLRRLERTSTSERDAPRRGPRLRTGAPSTA